MSVEALICQYGYLAILIGAVIEGEASLLAGGLAAQAGYLDLPCVIGVAFFGTLIADQAYFLLARWQSGKFLARRPSWKRRVDRAESLLKRFRTPLILLFRFLYGIRIMVIIAIGMSKIPASRFAVLNVMGAMIWVTVIGTTGYLSGSVLVHLLGAFKEHEFFFGAVLLSVPLMICTFRFLLRKWVRK
jgi:membrane protein DedA with SNARE-associated domain